MIVKKVHRGEERGEATSEALKMGRLSHRVTVSLSYFVLSCFVARGIVIDSYGYSEILHVSPHRFCI